MRIYKHLTQQFLAMLVLLVGVGNTTASAQVLVPGEEITYAVSYLGINLGTIKIITESKVDVNGKPTVKAKALIDSRAGIPFVDLHTTYTSWMDPSATFSQQFEANTKESDGWLFDKYTFDYSNKKVITEKWKKDQLKKKREIDITKKYSDGLSLFFVARQLLYSKKTATIPCMVMEDTVRTVINFSGKNENVEIDACNYPVRCVFFDGNANWTGVYGVTGSFEGWFSDDEARVPIKAKMKLYLGKADIELVSWKRPGGWQPPKAN